MSAKQISDKVKVPKVSSKETMVNEISLKISAALTALKEQLGEKKFDKRIRKAAKLLIEGIKPDDAKSVPVKKTAPARNKKAKVPAPKKVPESTPSK